MTENFVIRTWNTTPTITRSIAILATTISFLVYIKAISPFYLSYSTFYVMKLQLWRIITCFFYFGPMSIETALHIIFMCRYSRMLEEGLLHTSDYFYMLFTVMSMLFALGLAMRITVLGSCLSSTITYVWTRRNPNTHVQLLGCVVFPAFYLPFVVPLFAFMSERKIPKDDLVGILVGHVYYYFKYVYPRFGSDVLKTPLFLKKMFGEDDTKTSNTNTNVNNTNVNNVNENNGNINNTDVNDSVDADVNNHVNNIIVNNKVNDIKNTEKPSASLSSSGSNKETLLSTTESDSDEQCIKKEIQKIKSPQKIKFTNDIENEACNKDANENNYLGNSEIIDKEKMKINDKLIKNNNLNKDNKKNEINKISSSDSDGIFVEDSWGSDCSEKNKDVKRDTKNNNDDSNDWKIESDESLI